MRQSTNFEFYPELYHQDVSSHVEYSHQAKGQLNIQRLIKGLPAWAKTSAKGKKPKTLILTTCSVIDTQLNVSEIRHIIEDLLTATFPVFVLSGGQFREVSISNYEELLYNNPVQYIKSTEIIELAHNQLGLSANRFFYLDRYWFKCLDANSRLRPHRSLVIDDSKVHDDDFWYQFIPLELTALPPLKHFVLDDLGSSFSHYRNKVKHLYPTIPFQVASITLEISENELIELMNQKSITLSNGKIFSLGSEFRTLHLKYLTEQLEVNFETSSITKIILEDCNVYSHFFNDKNFENLNQLEMIDCSFEENSFKTLTKLKSLYLQFHEGYQFDLSFITDLIGRVPNVVVSIEQLSNIINLNLYPIQLFLNGEFDNDRIGKSIFLIENEPFKIVEIETKSIYLGSEFHYQKHLNLKYLNCYQTCPIKTLEIFKYTPTIETIIFDSIQSLDVENIANESFQKLEHLEFISCTLSDEFLIAFMNKSPNLRVLKLKNCNLSSKIHETSGKIFKSNLREIYLEGDSLSSSLFNLILNSIEYIHTFSLKNLKLNTIIYFVQFKFLTDLILENVALTYFHFNTLIAAPLKSLTISKVTFRETVIPIKLPKSLNVLKLVKISKLNPFVKSIFESAPNFKVLELYNCTCSLEFLKFHKFKNIEQMSIINCSISESALIEGLIPASNLKSLVLKNIQWSNAEDSKSVSLPTYNLKKLELDSLNISPYFLQSVLNNASDLSELVFTSVSTSGASELFWMQLPKLQYCTIHRSSITSAQILELLHSSLRLLTLNISSCDNLDKNFLKKLRIKSLSKLVLENNDIDKNTIEFLVENLNLDFLDFENCINLDNLCLNLLKSADILYQGNIENYSHQSFTYNTSLVNYIDANTQSAKTRFELKKIFRHCANTLTLPTSNYRIDIYNDLLLNTMPGKPESAFQVAQTADPIWQDVKVEIINNLNELTDKNSENSEIHWIGRYKMILGPAWKALPSISYSEILEKIHFDLPVQVEIKYSCRDNLYYLRTNKAAHVTINYLLKLSPIVPVKLPSFVEEYVQYFQSFNAEALSLNQEFNYTGLDYLNAIIEQKTGSCRHRAFASAFILKKFYPVRIITNFSHVFIEILLENTWVSLDLGGYFAELIVDDPFIDTFEHEKKPVIEPELRYEKSLKTWNKLSTDSVPSLKYISAFCLPSHLRKQLLILNEEYAVHAIHLILLHECKTQNIPYYYIHTADELLSSYPYLHREQNSGVLKAPPGGEFYNFLQSIGIKNEHAILVVNFSKFTPAEIVAHNSLLDSTPKADGLFLPSNLKIIGIQNVDDPQAYLGGDFYSRFDKKEAFKFETNTLEAIINNFAPLEINNSDQELVCDQETVYFSNNDLNWKEKLLGQVKIQGQSFEFKKGPLIVAIENGDQQIQFYNAPWHDFQFISFLKQLIIKQEIEISATEVLKFKEFPKIVNFKKLNLKDLLKNVKTQKGFLFDSQIHVLNSSTLPFFFNIQEIESISKQLFQRPGIIEQHQSDLLRVNYTGMEDDEWLNFLIACKHFQVSLKVYYPQTMHFNESFYLRSSLDQNLVNDVSFEANTKVFISDDLDVSLHHFLEANDYIAIDCSEFTGTDIIESFTGKLNKETCNISFSKRNLILINALNAGKNVLLYGSFSQELIYDLTPLFFERQLKTCNNQLICLTDSSQYFDFWPIKRLLVSPIDKVNLLAANFSSQIDTNKLADYSNHPYCHSRAILKYAELSPKFNPWAGFDKLNLSELPTKWNLDKSEEISIRLNKERFQLIILSLTHSPFVFIAGSTGIGKTTTILELFPKIYGLNQLVSWIEDDSSGYRILFIDEANLLPSQWSLFEGLFLKNKSIVVEGNYYHLTEQHKVIFAGNPSNYSAERHTARLFKRHGQSIIFNPLPLEFIFEKSLKPLFKTFEITPKALITAVEPMLKIFSFLSALSDDKALITARDLQSMVLSYLADYSCRSSYSAAYHAYQIGKFLVPAEHLEEFDQQFKFEIPYKVEFLLNNFLITASRFKVIESFDRLLQMRTFRIKNSQNGFLQKAGIRTWVLEGAPGQGKSELVNAFFHERNYKELSWSELLEMNHCSEQSYCKIPVTLNPEIKNQVLIKAFHLGLIVIMDEMNSCVLAEELLNNLLMGYGPHNEDAQVPGFCLIGTQNPSTMQGRYILSHALEKRLFKIKLPDYTEFEMLQILTYKGIDVDDAQQMVTAYLKNKQIAASENYNPAPTFRDVLHLTKSGIPILQNSFFKRKAEHNEEFDREPLKKKF